MEPLSTLEQRPGRWSTCPWRSTTRPAAVREDHLQPRPRCRTRPRAPPRSAAPTGLRVEAYLSALVHDVETSPTCSAPSATRRHRLLRRRARRQPQLGPPAGPGRPDPPQPAPRRCDYTERVTVFCRNTVARADVPLPRTCASTRRSWSRSTPRRSRDGAPRVPGRTGLPRLGDDRRARPAVEGRAGAVDRLAGGPGEGGVMRSGVTDVSVSRAGALSGHGALGPAVDRLLADAQARRSGPRPRDFGLIFSAVNAAGNPLQPRPGAARSHGTRTPAASTAS